MAPRHAVLADARLIAEIQIAASRAAYQSIMNELQLDALDVRARTDVWSGFIEVLR